MPDFKIVKIWEHGQDTRVEAREDEKEKNKIIPRESLSGNILWHLRYIINVK